MGKERAEGEVSVSMTRFRLLYVPSLCAVIIRDFMPDNLWNKTSCSAL